MSKATCLHAEVPCLTAGCFTVPARRRGNLTMASPENEFGIAMTQRECQLIYGVHYKSKF